MYFADIASGAIRKWTAATKEITTPVLVGLKHPNSVAVDALGNIYIADTGHNAIKKWTAKTGQLTVLVFFLNQPRGVAVDRAGNVYIADTGNNAIEKWTAKTGQLTTLVSSLNGPVGVAVDTDGNVYFSDTNNNAVKEWVAASGQVKTLISSGLNFPAALALDGAGSVYIAEPAGYGAIKKWTAATGQLTTVLRGGLGFDPYGVATDAAGNLFVTWSSDYDGFRGSAISGPGAGSIPQAVIYSGPSLTQGVAVDTAGNVYFTTSSASGFTVGAIQEWTAPAGQLTIPVSSDFTRITGVAVDDAGDLYYAARDFGTIDKWTAATGETTVLAPLSSGEKYPPTTGIALDRNGDVYYADAARILYPPSDTDTVKEWTAGTGQVKTLVSGLTTPEGVALDAADNLYFSVQGLIKERSSANGDVFTLISGQHVPKGTVLDPAVAVDGAGDVYFSSGGAIEKWAAATGEISILTTALSATSLAVDKLDNLYAVSGDIEKLTRAFVSPAAFVEPLTAGSDHFLPVLPAGTPLDAVSDQPWLTITSQNHGVVHFSFKATKAQRTAHISLLGQTIPVTQANMAVPTVVSYSVLWGSQTYTITGSTRNRLPWEITGIRVMFSKPIASGTLSSLGGVTATALTGLGTNTLTWTLEPVSLGRYTLKLATSGPDALADSEGNPVAGDTTQRIRLLWGDINDDGVVNATDLALAMTQAQGSYSIFADMNGDGLVDSSDVQIVRMQIGNRLP